MALVCSVFAFVTHFFYLQWFALYLYFSKDYCISTSLLCLYICHTFLVLLVLPFFASGNPYLPYPAHLGSICISIKDENDFLKSRFVFVLPLTFGPKIDHLGRKWPVLLYGVSRRVGKE